jgi:multidrug efflux pump subunit AcrA (membrane-fusion protein)
MRRLAWVVAGAVALAGAGFAVATVADADSGSRYRVATVSVGDVAQAVSVSGTVDRVNRADVAFGTDGTLASLSVAVGDSVSAGQELGALDTTSLQAAVDKATADVDSAESNLSDAEDAVEEESSSEPADDSSRLVQEVKNAQSASSAALKAASEAVTAQTTACADPASTACASAGATTLTAQQAVQKAQDTLQAKLDALSAALASSQQSSSGPSQDSPSASSVAEAQAAVDEAKVKLVEAEQALAGATLKSPITGTVASVTGVAGDQVSANTAVVVVVGEGAAEVSATVAVEQLSKLSVGQEATVTPVGTSEQVTGSVTRVSTLPDPNADSVAYPVTITIAEPPATMAAGSSATASIVVATAEDVLTVPTSAVNRNTVTLLNADQTTTVTRVTVGAVGPTRTEITEGVFEGNEVVLANLDSPLPTSDQSTQGGFTNGGPGGGGGGGPMMRTRPGN